MRTYENWDTIFDSGDYTLETRLQIYNGETPTAYTQISAPKINRSLSGSALSIGNVNTATLEVSILTTDTIPVGAKVVVEGKLKNASLETDWVEFGTFWIDKRSSGYGGLVTLICYDAMMRANQGFNYTAQEILSGKQMADVVNDVATRIGVQIDDRTEILADELGVTNPTYLMTVPTDMTMSEALGYIGQINGGNWIITEENKLRLVPLFYSDGSVINVQAILGSYSKEASTSISMIKMTDSENYTYSQGADGGFVLNLTNPYANDTYVSTLYETLQGIDYYPYSMTKVVINPLFELGDSVKEDAFIGQIVQTTLTLDLSFRADIKAHDTGHTESEYPYESEYVRLLNAVSRVIDTTVTNLDETVNGEGNKSVKTILGQIKTTISDIQFNYVKGEDLQSWIRFDVNGITLGAVNSKVKLRITNQKIFFFDGEDDEASEENALAYFSDNELVVNYVVPKQKMTIGNYYWQLEEIDGSLSLVYQAPETE